MSSAASISAAKKRRANQVQPPMTTQQPQQPMQRPMTAPPSLANLTPVQRQQMMQQQQQRMQQQQPQQKQQQQPQQQQRMQPQQQSQQQQSQQQQSQQQSQQQVNRKQPQLPGKTQPNQKAGLTWPVPPIYLMKQMDTMLFQQSQTMDDIKNRLNCIESGSISESGLSSFSESELDLDQIKPALMADSEFVSGIVDNIMNNSNLSEIIEQIDAVQTENRELRDLLHAQQKTINEMNIMLLKLFSQSLNQPAAFAPAPKSKSSAATVVVQDLTAGEPPCEMENGTPEDDVDACDVTGVDDEDHIQLDVVEPPPSNMQIVD